MSQLNWTVEKHGEANEHVGRCENGAYYLRKRNDGYVNVWFRPTGGAWEDEIQLNDKRVRIVVGKDMAQAHAFANAEDSAPFVPSATVPDSPAESQVTPVQGVPEDEDSSDPTPASTTDKGDCPIIPTTTPTHGKAGDFFMEEGARQMLRSVATKGERRKIRKELRKNGFPALAGLSV